MKLCNHNWLDAGQVALPAVAKIGSGITWVIADAKHCEKCGEMKFFFKRFDDNRATIETVMIR